MAKSRHSLRLSKRDSFLLIVLDYLVPILDLSQDYPLDLFFMTDRVLSSLVNSGIFRILSQCLHGFLPPPKSMPRDGLVTQKCVPGIGSRFILTFTNFTYHLCHQHRC